MTHINFRKLVTQKEVINILINLANEMGSSFCIEDTSGKLLIGTDNKVLVNKHPVKLLDEVVGWVIGDKKAETIAFLLSYLAQQQYEKKLLANELLDKYQEIDLFHDIFTQVTASLNPKEVARLVIEEARKSIQSTSASILLFNNNTGQLDTLWKDGQNGCFEKPLIQAQGIISTIVKSCQGEIVNDVFSDPRFVNNQVNFHSFICVPLITKKQVIGAIVIISETPTTYSTQDLKLLTILALQTAVAIEKAVLYEQNCNALHVAQEQTQQLQRTLYELQQTQTQLIQSEKMSSLGQLVAGVAHEINNPVNYVAGNLNYAQQYTQDLLNLLHLYQKYYPQPVSEIEDLLQDLDLEFLKQDFINLLSSMHLGIERIRSLASSLRNFSRLDREEMKPVDIHEGIDATLLILQSRLKQNERHQGIEIVKEYGNIPLIEGYANQLNQVFMNLIANAIDAIEEQEKPGIINIYTGLINEYNFQQAISRNSQLKDLFKISSLESEHQIFSSVFVVISDNGMGIDETVRKHLFEPFFTTKPTSKGTGLGLSISSQIIEKHGGTLQCISHPGQGTTFWIEIPVEQTIRKSSETNVTVFQPTL
ncbi:histidine kinase [Scytonema hofmannii PCC 7110]|uniref:histidine kinase n=1 Tax=Scytonema hofmannii PCC 7110 TaxID=128403 RepID=A0A139WUQ4_9CYAN|nr:ATP-binding protein [Scytonema hofmannii]KYC36154.1 histidine kinase [Scytonema hofmannii PCC 7110]